MRLRHPVSLARIHLYIFRIHPYVHMNVCERQTYTGMYSLLIHMWIGIYLSHTSSVLQCIAVCWSVCGSVLQCVTVCCSVLQCVAVCCRVWQCVSVCCSVLLSLSRVFQTLPVWMLQFVAVCCSVLQCGAVRCMVLQCVAWCCNVL